MTDETKAWPPFEVSGVPDQKAEEETEIIKQFSSTDEDFANVLANLKKDKEEKLGADFQVLIERVKDLQIKLERVSKQVDTEKIRLKVELLSAIGTQVRANLETLTSRDVFVNSKLDTEAIHQSWDLIKSVQDEFDKIIKEKLTSL